MSTVFTERRSRCARKLRRELPAAEKEKIMTIIEKLSKEET